MKSIIPVLAFLLAICGALLMGCGGYDQESWNQKVIVEVETPDGPVTGSSVQHVRYSKANFQVPAGASHSFKATGEAVVVDLGAAGVLFALLKGEEHHGDAGKLAPIAFLGQGVDASYGSREAVDNVVAQPEGSTAELPRRAYPVLVTFRNIDDPATVERVDPNNLAATFGPGYALSSITLEITDEKVTEGRVEEVLGWLDDYYDLKFDGRRYETIRAENRFANSLSSGAFKAGD